MRPHTQSIKIFVRNFLLQFILGGVQLGLTPKTGGRRGGSNVIEDGLVTIQRFASPIGADQIEHAMFNRVPFGSAGGVMGDGDNQAKFIGQMLEAQFPNATPVPIGSAAVGLDQQMLLVWIKRLSHRQPPSPNGSHSKLWGVVRSADRDKALIVPDVVNAVGNGFSVSQTGKVVHIHLSSPLTPCLTRVLKIANHLCFLGIDTNDWPAATYISLTPADNIAKLLISFRELLTGHPFVVNLQRIILLLQQTADRWRTDRLTRFSQNRLNFTQRLVCPFQPRDGVSGRLFDHHLIQYFQQVWLFFPTLWRPPPTARMRPSKPVFAGSISRWPRLMVSRCSPVILDKY